MKSNILDVHHWALNIHDDQKPGRQNMEIVHQRLAIGPTFTVRINHGKNLHELD
jgi:hypothetical protein